MSTSNKTVLQKRRPGRPATGTDPVIPVRISTELTTQIDAWAARAGERVSRSEAIRRLVELGLTVKGKSGSG